MPIRRVTPADPQRNTRVSSYQARIERSLTDFYVEVPEFRQGSADWQLISVGHTRGHATCELCHHNPIRRLFWIKSIRTGEIKMVGSECAVNFASADLVRGYMRRIERNQANVRRNRRNEEAQALREQRNNEIRSEAVTLWQSFARHLEVADFLLSGRANWANNGLDRDDTYLGSLTTWLLSRGYLSESQYTNACNIIDQRTAQREVLRQEVSETPVRPGWFRQPMQPSEVRRIAPMPNEEATRMAAEVHEAMATPVAPHNTERGELPHIADATYTVRGAELTMRFQIHTVSRGSLAGKRIIKINQDGAYKGFAFLTSTPGVKTWASAQEWVTAPMKTFARAMVSACDLPHWASNATTRHHVYNDMEWSITRTDVVEEAQPRRTATTAQVAADGMSHFAAEARHAGEAARNVRVETPQRRHALVMSAIHPNEVR